MGKRGHRQGQRLESKAAPACASAEADDQQDALFRPIPQNKRHQLNGLVDNLYQISSNFAEEPKGPTKLYEEFEKLYSLVEKVRELEKRNMSRKISGPRAAYVKPFVNWLKQHDTLMDGVEVADFGAQGLGLKVTKDLEQGDLVISIPRKVCMTTETAQSSTVGILMDKAPLLQHMSNVGLALHLLFEKNSPASFWEPYINVLPRSYNTVLYYTPQQFQELRGSIAFEEALKQFKFIARQYAYFYQKFQSMILKDYFTYDEYRWAVSTVMTRQNQVPSATDPEKMCIALIPFWDFANHDNGHLSTDDDPVNQVTKCFANRAFKSGEQFTVYYGDRSNVDFLVHNGFVVENNCSDCLSLRLGVSRNDPLAHHKYKLLDLLDLQRQGLFQVWAGPEQRNVSNQLMAFVRVITMATVEEIESWSQDPSTAARLLQPEPIAAANLDRRAYQYLLTRCELIQKSYPTSLSHDDELVQAGRDQLAAPVLDCVLLRRNEKRLLQWTVDHCLAMLEAIRPADDSSLRNNL